MPAWQGIFGPANKPKEVVNAYYAAMQDLLKDAGTIEKMATLGSQPVTGVTPAEFDSSLAKDRKQWANTARAANISLK